MTGRFFRLMLNYVCQQNGDVKKAMLEKDATWFHSSSGTKAYPTEESKAVTTNPAGADSDAQDDALWDQEFADSQETLSRLAAQSRAHREAGRTKRIV